jgi:hypothetical protein
MSVQVSEQFLRRAARAMRDQSRDGTVDNRAWDELMQEVRGRIAMGLDELDVTDYPPTLGPEDRVTVNAVLEWIRSLLRRGEL